MGKGYLNLKCCFSLNCCFSSNWCFNPILFKTPLTSKDGIRSSWKDGISSSMGLSDFFENTSENFLSDNGSVYDIQSSSNNPISRSNNNYPHGEINNRPGSSEPSPDLGIHMPSGGDSSDIGDTGNGALPFEKGRTCGESGESDTPNPEKGNDLPLREDSKDQKSTDGDPALGDSKNQKPKDNDSDQTHSDDSDQTHLDDSDDSDQTHSDDSDQTHSDDSNQTHSDDSNQTHSDDSNQTHSDDSNQTHSYRGGTPPHIAALWVQCEDCLGLNYKRFLKERNNLCEHCAYHFKMNSPERIEFLIDPDTWDPIDEDMASPDPDPYEWDSEEDNFSEERSAWDSEEDNFSEDPSEWDSKEDNFSEDEDPIGFDLEKDNFSEERSEWDSEEDNFSEERSEWDSEEDNFSEDPSEWDSEEEEGKSYEDRLDSYRRKTGLNEAVQTGVGQLNGIPVAFGIMEFEFMGGSMGSVAGEKIARLVEYATNQSLPLIIVCASGGARMQEGSLSLMQMAKISSILLDRDQSNNKLLYISILTTPTTGGVTASFGTLADIIIAEPNSYIAFAGKRVIEETLKEPIPEGSQEAEPLFEKGILDLIIPRKLLKDVLTEFLKFHDFNPLNSNSIK